MLDSHPAYFLGDSQSYLATATFRWIPPDRSFLYGFFIRKLCFRWHSLEILVIVQVFLSGIAAWMLALVLLRIFRVRFSVAFLFGVLCAVEPLQLLMERYVMTETCANFLFVAYLGALLIYVRDKQLGYLAVGQVIGVLLIAFRISFLPLVIANSIFVPLSVSIRSAGRALAVSVGSCLCLLFLYAQLNGHLKHDKPALFYANGVFLISDFAPLIQRQDFPAYAPAEAILAGVTIDRSDLNTRSEQHFWLGGLVKSLERAVPDPHLQNKIEIATAVHALVRDPLGGFKLACSTFRGYFDRNNLRSCLLVDEGSGQHFDPGAKGWLLKFYGVQDTSAFEASLTKSWHSVCFPWYWAVLIAMCISPLFWFFCKPGQRHAMAVCILAALISLEGVTLTVDRPTPRFLTSAAWLVLLMLGVAVDGVPAKLQVFMRAMKYRPARENRMSGDQAAITAGS